MKCEGWMVECPDNALATETFIFEGTVYHMCQRCKDEMWEDIKDNY